MKFFIHIAKICAAIVFMVFSHLAVAYFLPYPWNSLNTMLTIIVLLIMTKETGLVVWLTFVAHFFIELYATTPFGIILCASTLSVLCTYWLSQSFFINKSWYTAFALSAVALILYRALYIILIEGAVLIGRIGAVPWPLLMRHFSWELLLTVIVTGLLSLAISRPEPRRQALLMFR